MSHLAGYCAPARIERNPLGYRYSRSMSEEALKGRCDKSRVGTQYLGSQAYLRSNAESFRTLRYDPSIRPRSTRKNFPRTICCFRQIVRATSPMSSAIVMNVYRDEHNGSWSNGSRGAESLKRDACPPWKLYAESDAMQSPSRVRYFLVHGFVSSLV